MDFMGFLDSLKLTWQSKTLIGCGLLGAAFGTLYYLYSTNQGAEEYEGLMEQAMEEYEKNIDQLRQMVKYDMEDGVLSHQSIKLIFEGVSLMMSPSYVKLMREARLKRRKLLKEEQMEEYEAAVRTHTAEIQGVVSSSLKRVLGDIGCPVEFFQESNRHWIEQNPSFGLMGARLLQSGARVPRDPSKPLVSVAVARELLELELATFPKMYRPKDLEVFTKVKCTILADLVFERYGVEEEDLKDNPPVMADDEAVHLSKQFMEMVQFEEEQIRAIRSDQHMY